MTLRVSVVIPVFNAEDLLADCLKALVHQSLPSEQFEIIVVDDGSRDRSSAVAEQFGARLIRRKHGGAPAARNVGIHSAHGPWIAFTDSDCIPSRGWLAGLLGAVDRAPECVGAAGPILGFESDSPAAQFVDLSRGLDAERHLSHPRFPFAPLGNSMYLQSALKDVGGFDERFTTYDACDLHLRIQRAQKRPFVFVPAAIVLHRHRRSWTDYWRQQFGYGRGYGQFLLKHRNEVHWNLANELRAIGSVAEDGIRALRESQGEAALIARGTFCKNSAQRLGSIASFWNPSERVRW